ncbi:MAG TPA: hypothetical protein VHA52_09180, partial [Candidatus Babeliaceae bacterium]|nr:hypothetical protein [Candidatus Babeliaceae bacterium]
NISGSHADQFEEIATLGVSGEPGRLKIIKTGTSAKGFEEAILILEGVPSKTKSLFPKNINWMGCAEMALEAISNLKTTEIEAGKRGECILKGITQKGEVLKFVINPKTGQIYTFYGSLPDM